MSREDLWVRKQLVNSLIFLAVIGVLAALAFGIYDIPSAPEAPPTATFDVYRWTEDGESELIATIGVALKDGEYMMAAKPGEPRYIYVFCEEGSETNPCGPGGYAPNRYGAVLAYPTVQDPGD